jgi:hypothetical protein
LTDNIQTHPADFLANRLEKVSGLARTLGDLYVPDSESFAAGNSFIAHGLVAISTLLNDAQMSLEDLHSVCDLSVKTMPAQAPVVEAPMVFPPVTESWSPETNVEVSEPMDSATDFAFVQPVLEDDQFAQSYLELLRKLTAAEVFAAEQQALAPPGSGQNLLPLLRSLREEFQKLHRVA